MFAYQITPIALIAIKHEEWNTLDYLIDQLSGWMESYDKDTADAASKIGMALQDKVKETNNHNIKFQRIIHSLYTYALSTYKELTNA